MVNLLIEAIVVGLVITVVGSIISWLIRFVWKSSVPENCKDWNKYYVMEIALFLTGFLSHLLFEGAGLNKWYCKNGFACK